MIIVLTPELEQALTVAAQAQGRTPEQLALDNLRDHFLAPEADLPFIAAAHRPRLPTFSTGISASCTVARLFPAEQAI